MLNLGLTRLEREFMWAGWNPDRALLVLLAPVLKFLHPIGVSVLAISQTQNEGKLLHVKFHYCLTKIDEKLNSLECLFLARFFMKMPTVLFPSSFVYGHLYRKAERRDSVDEHLLTSHLEFRRTFEFRGGIECLRPFSTTQKRKLYLD